MSDHPPPPPPPGAGGGGGPPFDISTPFALFPITAGARLETVQRLVNLTHGLPASEVESPPTYEDQAEAHKALQGYLKIAADREAAERKLAADRQAHAEKLAEMRRANDLKERAVRVQEKAERRKVKEHALKERAVVVQEENAAVKKADHQLDRERFEDARKTRKKEDSLAAITAAAEKRAEARKRERAALPKP